MVWKIHPLSNMAILGIYVKFQLVFVTYYHIVISALIQIHQIIHVMMDGQINEEYWRFLCVLPMDFPVLCVFW